MATTWTAAIRTPAMITGAAIGQFDPPQELGLAHAHGAARLDHVAVDLAQADVGVGEDRRDRQHDQRRERSREADPEPGHEDDQQGVGRDRPAEVGDAHRHERALPGVPDGEARRDGDEDGGDDRHRREHDVLHGPVGDARRAAPVGRVREPRDDVCRSGPRPGPHVCARRAHGVAIRPMVTTTRSRETASSTVMIAPT